MPQVRLTISPDQITEVPEAELAVLRQQGLLLDEQPPGAGDDIPDGQQAGGNPENEES